MTTLLAFLADLTVTEWVCIVLGSWLIVGVLIAPRIGRMIRRADEAEQPAAPEVVTEPDPLFVTVLREWERPPVPLPVSRHSAAEWLAAWPADDDSCPDFVPAEWSRS